MERCSMPMNVERVEKAVTAILEEIGEDPSREGLVETPNRVARMFQEICSSLNDAPPELKVFTNDAGYDQMVIVKDIPFYSLCEHHLATFFGTVSVGYLPKDKVVGLSKIGRTVEFFSKKPQLQERLTQEIANYLYDGLEPEGLIVMAKARHMCVESRGVKKSNCPTVTCAIKGNIDKQEFLNLLESTK